MRGLSNRVPVRHKTSGAVKHVLRSQLSQLGPNWERISERKAKALRAAGGADGPQVMPPQVAPAQPEKSPE